MSNQPIAAFAMTLVGVIAILICVAIPDWKKNDPVDTIRDNLRRVSIVLFENILPVISDHNVVV